MDEKKLILLVQGRSPLWNVSDENYNLTFLKEQLWKEIASEMNSDLITVKEKWQELRATFRDEYEKLIVTTDETENNSDQWEHYKELTFLSDSTLLEENSSKADSSGDDHEISSASGQTMNALQEFHPNDGNNVFWRQGNDAGPSSVNVLKSPRIKLNKKTNPPGVTMKQKSDSDLQFLMSLTPYLKKVPEYRKLAVRNKLQQVFIEEQMIQNSANNIPFPNIIHPAAAAAAAGIRFQTFRTFYHQ